MEALLAVSIGIGLSASSGFRILIPFFVMGMAAQSGHITLSEDMAWIGTQPAIIAFAVGSVIEVALYFIPWLDNLMDSIEIPVAIIAGVIITAAFIPEMSPWLRWSLAAIAGGTTAGATELLTSATRLASTTTTGGMGNSLVSGVELASAVILSNIAIAVPIVALVVVIALLFLSVKQVLKLFKRRSLPPAAGA